MNFLKKIGKFLFFEDIEENNTEQLKVQRFIFILYGNRYFWRRTVYILLINSAKRGLE